MDAVVRIERERRNRGKWTRRVGGSRCLNGLRAADDPTFQCCFLLCAFPIQDAIHPHSTEHLSRPSDDVMQFPILQNRVAIGLGELSDVNYEGYAVLDRYVPAIDC